MKQPICRAWEPDPCVRMSQPEPLFPTEGWEENGASVKRRCRACGKTLERSEFTKTPKGGE